MRQAGNGEWRRIADLDAAGFFGPQSLTWRIGSEGALLIGGGRAVLMQIAHPLVAAGVAQHSAYRTDPWRRFIGTLTLMESLTFGDRQEALDAARTVNQLHTRVTGTLDEAAGSFAAGTAYRARMHDLLLWVFATLIDTTLLLYPRLVGPLSDDEQEAYYQESRATTMLLGLPVEATPPTLAAFRHYMDDMLSGPTLAITPEAVSVARAVLHFPVPPLWLPALLPMRVVMEQATIGLLPPRLRDGFGFGWSEWQQFLLDREFDAIHGMLPLLPDQIRVLPAARAAWRRVRLAQAAS